MNVKWLCDSSLYSVYYILNHSVGLFLSGERTPSVNFGSLYVTNVPSGFVFVLGCVDSFINFEDASFLVDVHICLPSMIQKSYL